ncbi:hypothetical protein QBC47DRAFT_392290 [Echria macrotheca]|uniref:Cytochrome b561 domain-containing protein n=1 Tax=Echria macrotheca TaxID=438768 RepID=A0AAJ0B6K7_9PEZI|nr:hypothetical protein QBC47DRAFT_392290 [Echria macrotheca]
MRSLAAALAVATLAAVGPASAEPVQYCRTGYSAGEADFCVSLATYQNATTGSPDVFLSLRIPRSTAHGWTAIGTGAAMAGSLMIIVYGDPSSPSNPTVSIRTIDGHHQPHPLNSTWTPLPSDASVSILQSRWKLLPTKRHEDEKDYPLPPAGPATHAAEVSLVCHACTSSTLSITSHSQPFIWAWNDRQDFAGNFPLDARLEMHRHRSGSGGFGTFYVDMARSVIVTPDPSAARPPPILLSSEGSGNNVGTSDSPIGVAGFISSLRERPLPRLHGLLMTFAFLVLFPLGVVWIRARAVPMRATPFARHWIVQAAAMAVAWIAVAVGVVMTGFRPPGTWTAHQWVGIVIALALGVQSLLGWRHHVRFVRIRRRTAVSYGHIWLGRVVVGGGWANLLMGMWLSGHGGAAIGLVAGVVVVEAVGLGVWVARAAQTAKSEKQGGIPGDERGGAAGEGGVEDYFALEMSGDEFDDSEDEEGGDDDKQRLVKGARGVKAE